MATDGGLEISSAFSFEKKKAQVLGSHMAHVDVGTSSSEPVAVFLHGNTTLSYLWRNIVPHVANNSRCIVPDLIGFSDSDKVHYCRPFLDPVDREPVWRLPNEMSIEGHPKEVVEKAQRYTAWLLASELKSCSFG